MMAFRSVALGLLLTAQAFSLPAQEPPIAVAAPFERSLDADDQGALFRLAARDIAATSVLVGDPVFQVHRLVALWRAAWVDQRVDDYLGFYSETFVPGQGQTREQWASTRRRRVSEPSHIRVTVSELEVELESGSRAARAVVRFRQDFSSETVSDRGLKVLDLERDGEGWRIVREVWRPLDSEVRS